MSLLAKEVATPAPGSERALNLHFPAQSVLYLNTYDEGSGHHSGSDEDVSGRVLHESIEPILGSRVSRAGLPGIPLELIKSGHKGIYKIGRSFDLILFDLAKVREDKLEPLVIPPAVRTRA
ncbi:hypothetical protein [Candidatus Hakubella thermalkaliphila]|uniref:hypothetical protein n=1 Tax=Candidatus Hakubella thermalkaliphila TaxID=2754717 RepID=UPI002158B0F5|nr:hypothetical protein [Candidatus Hakubella thermalkaliphila]